MKNCVNGAKLHLLVRMPLMSGLGWGLALGVGMLNVAGVAQAFPNGTPLYGISGTGTMPSTETVPSRVLETGLAYEHIEPAFGGRVEFAPLGTLNYGFKNGEIGIGALREDVNAPFAGGDSSDTYTTIHAKYRFAQSRDGGAVALGAHYLDFGDTPGRVLSIYVVGSKTLLKPTARHTLTVNGGVLLQNINGLESEDNIRPFIRAQYGFKNGFQFAGRFRAARKDKACRFGA